jgi:hypothetical protein
MGVSVGDRTIARLWIFQVLATGEQFGNTIAHVPHTTFPVVPLVVKPVEQAVHEVAFRAGRASGA